MRRKKNNVEVLPPESTAVAVRIDAAHLALIARNARRLQVDPMMPKILKGLKKDAALGLTSSMITLDLESWRAVPLLSEISDRLLALGFQTKAAMKEASSRYDDNQPALHVVWGGVR